MITANGRSAKKMRKPQENVHDLDLFVTVQIIDEKPAVLSLGKLCDEHGYTYEWVSGEQPRLTKQGKNNLCKTQNLVPMVVPGLSSSSSASPSQHSSSASSSPATERCDELAPRNWSRNPARDSKDSNDRLRDLPEWLVEHTFLRTQILNGVALD